MASRDAAVRPAADASIRSIPWWSLRDWIVARRRNDIRGVASPANADIYYSDFDADTVTTSTMPAAVRYSGSYDQYGPSLDNDDTGNALIAYYDNSLTTGYGYIPLGRYVQQGGATVYGPAPLNYAGLGAYQPVHVGDYHEVFFWGTRWNNTWVRMNGDAHKADVFATGIR